MAELFSPASTSRQATYDLTRLRRKGFLERIGGTHTYRVTPYGRRIAGLFTRLSARVVVPTLTELEAHLRPRAPTPRPLVAAWRNYERQLDLLLADARLSA